MSCNGGGNREEDDPTCADWLLVADPMWFLIAYLTTQGTEYHDITYELNFKKPTL